MKSSMSDARATLEAEIASSHKELTELLNHPDITSNEEFKAYAEGIKNSADSLVESSYTTTELQDTAETLKRAKDTVKGAIESKELDGIEYIDIGMQIQADETKKRDQERQAQIAKAEGKAPTAEPKKPEKPLAQTPGAQSTAPAPKATVQTYSTQTSDAKKDSTQTLAKGIKPQTSGQAFSEAFSSSMNSRLRQGRKELENKSFPMGPLYKALFAAIETGIKNRRAEKAKQYQESGKDAAEKKEGEAPKAQAATTQAASVTTTTPTTASSTTPAANAANTQTIENAHGKVNVTKVAGKADSLSSSSPKALMLEVKERGYKSFTINSGSPEKALECMKEGVNAGVPHVALSKDMEAKVLANPKTAKQYKELKAEQDERLKGLKTQKNETTLSGQATEQVPNKPIPDEPRDKPLPPTPRNQSDNTLEATDTTKHAPTPMPKEPKPLPDTPQDEDRAQAQTNRSDQVQGQKANPEPKPEPPAWTNSNAAVLEAPNDKKGQALSDQMSSKKMETQDFNNLKESLGEKQYVQTLADATSAPTPKPANPPQNDQENAEQEQSMKAAQELKDQNLATARGTLTNEQMESYTEQVKQKALTKVDNGEPADTEIKQLEQTQKELQGEEENGNSQRPADPDVRSSSSTSPSNTNQNSNTSQSNASNANTPSNMSNSDTTSNANPTSPNAPNNPSSSSNTSSSFGSDTVGDKAAEVKDAQQNMQNQAKQPSSPSPNASAGG